MLNYSSTELGAIAGPKWQSLPSRSAEQPPTDADTIAASAAVTDRVKYIALYLPQFHPVPENDSAWGKGFTEWVNVTKAAPLFDGHYQPHLPTELGFYDLRLREVQHQQIEYAKRYGIDGFCFHYYWFEGKRVLERPVEDFLADPSADIEFCLCWANENWTRRWDGEETEVLIQQSYSPSDDIAFIESLLPYFRDPRYIRVDDAPVLLVYIPQRLPHARATIACWRQICRDQGIGEIHLVAALTHGNWEFESLGFDAGMEFPPHAVNVDNRKHRLELFHEIDGLVAEFGDIAEFYLAHDYTERLVYRGVFPSWDNSARVHGGGLVVLDGTPENYALWLHRATTLTLRERRPSQRLVFINAWNEWAEGCHLEPDRKHGLGFLQATQHVRSGEYLADHTFIRAQLRTSSNQLPLPIMVELQSLGIPDRIARLLSGYPMLFRAMRRLYRLTIKP